MNNEPIHVSDAEFEKLVIQSELPVIVDFWAPWCGPCRTVAPFLDSIAKDYAGKVVVAKVNTDQDHSWAMKFDVRGIPTMLFFSNGEMVWKQVGALPEKKLREHVDSLLEKVIK